jgi:hypothetical protein
MPTNPKPTLEMVHLPVFRVHYKNLEAYIRAVFGFDFDFLMAAGVGQGVGVDYRIKGVLESLAWEQRAQDLRKGRRTKDVPLILNVLAIDGYVPTGLYTISTHPIPNPIDTYTFMLRSCGNPLAPECIAFKAKHAGDKGFTERAAMMDKAITEALK